MDPRMQNMMMMSPYLKIKKLVEDDENELTEDEEEEDMEEEQAKNSVKKKRRSLGEGSGKGAGGHGAGGTVAQPVCLVENCGSDLSGCKRYHQRHRVCEVHAKSPVVLVDGLRQRFCQQCSRFHELSEFDQAKRSCRRRLAGHNERRRKSSLDSQREGSGPSRGLKENRFKQLNKRAPKDRNLHYN